MYCTVFDYLVVVVLYTVRTDHVSVRGTVVLQWTFTQYSYFRGGKKPQSSATGSTHRKQLVGATEAPPDTRFVLVRAGVFHHTFRFGSKKPPSHPASHIEAAPGRHAASPAPVVPAQACMASPSAPRGACPRESGLYLGREHGA